MTSKERFKRMYEHKEADRVPIIDSPWSGTFSRWYNEGLPRVVDWTDYFGIDRTAGVGVDNSPRYPRKTIEETDDYVIYTSNWGVTMKSLKHQDSTPEFLDWYVKTPDTWAEAKARMLADTDSRIPWDQLKNNYSRWVADGRWLTAGFWFGFDVTHSWMMGTENLLVAMCEEPEMAVDMFNTYLDVDIACYNKIYDAGYRFDCISWPDDMGYKGTTFFSDNMYRKMLMPVHKRAADWAHEHGMYVHLHSCGDVMSRVSDLVSIGIDALNPLEVKAGMKPLELKRDFGDKLVLHGGINAVLWNDRDAIISEIDKYVPTLKQNGGYIFSSDHSIPNSVSLDNFKAIISRVKEVGAY